MEAILSGLQWEKCLVYLDDIITFGLAFEETLQNVKSILNRLRSANLKLKPKTCVIVQEQVNFLGHLVPQDGIRYNPDKIEAVKNWSIPQQFPKLGVL
jgi:hypothetical protein